MVSPWPGGKCALCEQDLHVACIGWPTGEDRVMFCGCAQGECADRLRTTDHDDEGEP